MEELILQEEGHIYRIGDRRIVSVTQALSILDDRWKIDPWYLERGRLIDLACELYDRGELDEDSVDPQIEGYVSAYQNFVFETKFKVVHSQIKLYHPQYFYAGKPDVIGILNDDLDLIDRKSGAKAKVDPLQMAAYLELCRVNNIRIKKQFDLYLHENATYKLEPIEKPKLLLPVFLACLTATRFKERL